MARRKPAPSLQGLQTMLPGGTDQNALGNNMALDQRGVAASDAYYRNQEQADFGNVQSTAEDWRQHAAATMPGDPSGMRAFTQALKEKGAMAGSSLGLPESPEGQPSTIFDPMRQDSAVDPAGPLNALVALSMKRGKR